MQRVLDIDLDFFLSATCPFAGECERSFGAIPLEENVVRDFLEKKLKLSKTEKIHGEIFSTHDYAIDFWKSLIDEGKLTPPFTVVHVDAHSDLGIAQHGYPFIKNSVLCRPPKARYADYRALKQLNEANYLLFAMAYRWIYELVNLRIPLSKQDMPLDLCFGEYLQLKSAFPMLFEAKYGTEPKVFYKEYKNGLEYIAPCPFDFVSLALSPRYTPPTADFIVDIITEYMLL